FAIMIGYSRVPYAAAVEGEFFAPFARLHPKKNFPAFSVVVVGVTSAVASLLELDALIKALVILQILVQFLAQIVAVTLIRKYRPDIHRPFRMWLYPVPSVIAFLGWIYILSTNGISYVAAAFALVIAGCVAYLWRARSKHQWPFEETPA